MIRRKAVVALICGSLAASANAQTSVTIELTPTRDGTVIGDANGQLAAGIGRFMYFGSTNQSNALIRLRRALVHFDVAGNVPPGSTITDASLEVYIQRNRFAQGDDATLHRVTSDWGEGNSVGDAKGVQAKNNDATWLFSFWPKQTWTTPGGDFDAAPRATTTTFGPGNRPVWTSPDVIADVQDFLDHPATNHGWMIRGNEAERMAAVSIVASEDANTTRHPTLTITFVPVACSPADITTDGTSNGVPDNTVTLSDFSYYLTLWAASDPSADITADGGCVVGSGGDGVTLSDFSCYLSEWSLGCP